MQAKPGEVRARTHFLGHLCLPSAFIPRPPLIHALTSHSEAL